MFPNTPAIHYTHYGLKQVDLNRRDSLWQVARIKNTPADPSDANTFYYSSLEVASTHATAYDAISALQELQPFAVPNIHPLDALTALYRVASEERHSGAQVAAAVLLGLYNGPRFPFDLTELRRLDNHWRMQAMAVINFDSELRHTEVHDWLNLHHRRTDFGARFEELAHRFKIPNACEDINRTRNLEPLALA